MILRISAGGYRSGTLATAVLPGGIPVLQPGSRGLLPVTLPRLPFPWCGWDAWGCGGWSPVDVTSPTRPTCCPIPVLLREDVWDQASKPPPTASLRLTFPRTAAA
ncbi:hypothetical protein GOODEAATRI_008690 [Goodea atripinnis]|uniref:Uncharacterized protein n=1 Tax=Goodea atripinnis TaxID=208336 RepID=A0ABV0PCI3_9TELE